jgi:hypothetical protein
MKQKRQIRIIFSCLPFVFYSCSHQSDVNVNSPSGKEPVVATEKNSVKEDVEGKIMDAVMNLPEVIRSNAYIDSISNHKKGIAGITDAPADGETDYSVKVGYNGDERFEVYYFFYVNPKTMQIKVQDIVLDSLMLYNDWHKMKSEEN